MNSKRWSVWYIGIIVCAIIMGIDGILGFIASFSFFGAGWLWGGATLFGILFLIISILEIVAAIGIVKLIGWAYELTLGINIAGVVLTIVLVAAFSSVLGTLGLFGMGLSTAILPDIILPLLIIGYLLIPKVKAMFEAPPE